MKYAAVAMLPDDTATLYAKAANAKPVVSIMSKLSHEIEKVVLPIERAGWKYTATVATRCIPSLFPMISENKTPRVANVPNQYASVHFNTL